MFGTVRGVLGADTGTGESEAESRRLCSRLRFMAAFVGVCGPAPASGLSSDSLSRLSEWLVGAISAVGVVYVSVEFGDVI